MKKSEKIALVCIVVGTAAGFALNYWIPFLPTWADVMLGAIVAAQGFQILLRMEADISINDSKSINDKSGKR